MSDSIPDWVEDKLKQIITPEYYGKTTLHWKNGQVVLLREERTYVNDNSEYRDESGDS